MKKVLIMLGLFVLFCDISYAAEQFSGIWKNQKNCSFSYGSLGPLTTSDIEIILTDMLHFIIPIAFPLTEKFIQMVILNLKQIKLEYFKEK